MRAYRSARDPNHRRMFLRALGSFEDRSLLERSLKFALGPEVNSTDAMAIPWQIFKGDEEQRASMIEWIVANYGALAAKVPAMHAARLIHMAEGPDPALFERARAFLLAPERTSSLAEKNAAEVGDRIALQAAVRERERPSILAFLQDIAEGSE